MKRRALLSTVGVGGVTLAGCLSLATESTESWPQLGANAANTGTTSNTAPAENLSTHWTFKTDEYHAGAPAVVDGSVYIVSGDQTFYALDAESGDRLWSFDLTNTTYTSLQGMTPAVDNGIIYVGDGDGVLYALDSSTEEVEWQFNTSSQIESAPTIADETLYVWNRENDLYAIDAKTGKKRWRFESEVEFSYEWTPAVSDGIVYTGAYAIDTETGETVWEATDGQLNRVPTVADGTVYCGGVLEFGDPDPWNGESNNHGMRALDTETGDERWRYEGAGVNWSPAVTNTTVYAAGGGAIHAIDTETGERQWFQSVIERGNQPRITVNDGTVYASGVYSLYAFDAESGHEKWSYDHDAEIPVLTYAPVIVDGVIYQGSLSDGLLMLG